MIVMMTSSKDCDPFEMISGKEQCKTPMVSFQVSVLHTILNNSTACGCANSLFCIKLQHRCPTMLLLLLLLLLSNAAAAVASPMHVHHSAHAQQHGSCSRVLHLRHCSCVA
jgi:hypothetical protein